MILNSISPNFTKHVKIDTLLPYLLKHELLTSDEESDISNKFHTTTDNALKLVRILRRKGSGTLQKLLCCLNLACEHTGHKEIAEKLKQEMEAKGITDCDKFCSYYDCKEATN